MDDVIGDNMTYKYGDIIRLKDNARPQMSLDAETFFNLPDEAEDEDKDNDNNVNNGNNGNNDNNDNNDKNDKIKTYWGLPESAFETDDWGYVYLKSEYAKRLVWGVDEVIRIHDDFGAYEYDWLNINVAYDPEGIVNCGAFCSFVSGDDIDTGECNDTQIRN